MKCSNCGKESNGTNGNGSKALIDNEFKHQEELGKLEHANLKHRIETIETTHTAQVKARDVEIRLLHARIGEKDDTINKKLDDKFKFSLLILFIILTPIGSYSIASNSMLDDKITSQFEGIFISLEKEIDLVRENVKSNTEKVGSVGERIALIEGRR